MGFASYSLPMGECKETDADCSASVFSASTSSQSRSLDYLDFVELYNASAEYADYIEEALVLAG